jgi:hypothetical protein
MMRIRPICVVAVLALGFDSACGTDSSTSPAGSLVLTASAGTAQTAAAGHAVAIAPAVTAMTNSQLTAATVVTFAVTGGGGSVTGATGKTDSTGTARVGSWTLGTTPGVNTLTASAIGAATVTFTATAVTGAAAVLSKSVGDGQTAAVGQSLTIKPAVLVADQFGNPVAGVGVTFAIGVGGGSISGAASVTGSNGIATLGGWTLGTLAGANSVTATVTGNGLNVNSVTFTENGVAGPVATLTKVAGDNLSAVAGSLLSTLASVRLADQFGNVVANQTTTFAVTSGGGSVTGATPTSTSAGIATVGGWTLGSAVGLNTLTASSGSAQTVIFTAIGTAAFNASQYAGNYAGTWTNTTFNSTGTSSATVSVNTVASTMSIAFAVTGQVLGQGGVNTTQGGSYTNNGASVSNIVVPVMGTVTFAIDAAGNITASGTNIPNASINHWNAAGTITATQVRMNYTVTFNDNSTAVGTISLNHS